MILAVPGLSSVPAPAIHGPGRTQGPAGVNQDLKGSAPKRARTKYKERQPWQWVAWLSRNGFQMSGSLELSTLLLSGSAGA
ncbi:Sorting Nexin-31 [Manis pentadactyla]|nr:Sorting Nexin-31 [Manis pentadactyla]